MPPNKKKKKPAANPARGFATVSVPSKPKPEPTDAAPTKNAEAEQPEKNSGQPVAGERQQQQPPTTTTDNGKTQDEATTTTSQHQYSPEEIERHLEESELQLLVEKYASKCKYDATRQATKLETDRRVMRQQAVPLNISEWIPSEMLHHILQLAETEEEEHGEPGKESTGAVAKRTTTSREDLWMKMWTLKETLLKLGFPEEKIDDSLKHLLLCGSAGGGANSRDMVWNLEEALDWMAMHCSADGLPSYMPPTAAQVPKDASENFVSFIAGKKFLCRLGGCDTR